MKTVYALMFVLIAGLVSCSSETSAPIESFSADKAMKVSVTGSRSSSLDPWMLDIELTHAGVSSKVQQEFYANEVSEKNVVFQWESNTMCLIRLTQRDGVVITVPIEVNE